MWELGCFADDVVPMGKVETMLDSWQNVDENRVLGVCYLAWSVSYRRNQIVFSGNLIMNNVLVNKAHNSRVDYGIYAKRIYGLVARERSRSWRQWVAPPKGTMKVNTNTSVGDDGWVGFSMVATDEEGSNCGMREEGCVVARKDCRREGYEYRCEAGVTTQPPALTLSQVVRL